MKQKLLDLFEQHTELLYDENDKCFGSSIENNEFDIMAEEIVKLFSMHRVSGSCTICNKETASVCEKCIKKYF